MNNLETLQEYQFDERQVWKYELNLEPGFQVLQMPDGAEIVHCGTQNGVTPTVWVEVCPSAPVVPRSFIVLGTGHSFGGLKHCGSMICKPYVWHIYENVR